MNPITNHSHNFNLLVWYGVKIWFGLVLLFSLGRFFYLIDYFNVLEQHRYTIGELIYVLLSSMRFDFSISTFLILPLVIFSFLGVFIKNSRLLERVVLFYKLYGWVALSIALLGIVADHFYYIYFKDHFNVFFWEMWENFNNSRLVIDSIKDVITIEKLVLTFAGGYAIIFLLNKSLLIRHSLPLFLTKMLKNKYIVKSSGLIWLILIFLFARSTFDPRPLPLQDRRLSISANSFINLLHTNPLLPLFRGYKDWQEFSSSKKFNVNTKNLNNDFAIAKTWIPNANHKNASQGYHYFSQDLKPSLHHLLIKRPKHVILLFLESFSTWVTEYEEEGFAQAMTPNFLQLKKEGLYFAHHFPPGGGTIKNLAQINMSFLQPRNFHPSVNYHKEGLKPFPNYLAKMMEKLGYHPRFFYAGQIPWHRLYHFLPILGYKEHYADHSFPGIRKHYWGLYDEDFFNQLHKTMLKTSKKTFNFILTQSNHPPFYVPPEFKFTIKLPKSISKRILVGPKQFAKRINAFRYSDYSLGKFFEQASKSPYFKDTLFVITADHPFRGGISYSQDLRWKENQIPLLFYAPHLLKKEFIGKELKPFTTHLDLMPTLVSLLTNEPVEVHTWGKNIFSPNLPEVNGFNYFFSCLKRYCLVKNQLFYLDEKEYFQTLPNDDLHKSIKSQISKLDKAYNNTALHYLYKFEKP